MSIYLSDEQQKIISYEGDMIINAVAGSGKTTTLIEFAKSRPNAKILYICFNRSVADEAKLKFEKLGLTNIRAQTIHSSASYQIVYKGGYKVINSGNLDKNALIKLLKIKPTIFSGLTKDETDGLKRDYRVITDHVFKYYKYYCNQNKTKFEDLDYTEVVYEEDSKKFVNKHYDTILGFAKRIYEKMDKCEIDVDHDFYLKKYQLTNPKLYFHYVLFDEGQDASPVALDIFLKQKHAKKIIVGDVNQQIYAWKYAINALKEVDFPPFSLTNSFRFNQEIADLASRYLSYKKHINPDDFQTVDIKGLGKSESTKTQAILTRSNSALFDSVLSDLHKDEKQRIYIEGGFSPIESGYSIYDVYHLWAGNTERIGNEEIKELQSFSEL